MSKWEKQVVSLARLLPEVTDEGDEQSGGHRSRGNAELEPKIQTHASADSLGGESLSSGTPQRLLPDVRRPLKRPQRQNNTRTHTHTHLVNYLSLKLTLALPSSIFGLRRLVHSHEI